MKSNQFFTTARSTGFSYFFKIKPGLERGSIIELQCCQYGSPLPKILFFGMPKGVCCKNFEFWIPKSEILGRGLPFGKIDNFNRKNRM